MPLLMLFFSISSFIATGIQSTCGYYVGANNTTYAQKCFNVGLIFFFIIVCVIAIICILFNQWIAVLLGAIPGEVSFDYIKKLIIVIGLGAPGMMLTQVLLLIVLIDSGKKLPAITAVILFLSNILLSAFNLFVLKIGIFGIGLSVSLSFYLSTAALCFYFLNANNILKEKIKYGKRKRIKRTRIRKSRWWILISSRCFIFFWFWIQTIS